MFRSGDGPGGGCGSAQFSENGGREGGEAAAGFVVHNRAQDVDFGEKKTCVDMGQ